MTFNALYKNKIGLLQIDWAKYLTWKTMSLIIYFVELCASFLWMIIYFTMTTILFINMLF